MILDNTTYHCLYNDINKAVQFKQTSWLSLLTYSIHFIFPIEVCIFWLEFQNLIIRKQVS